MIAGTYPLVSDLVEAPTFSTIQDDVFSRCDGCHDNSPAGGLNLTPGNAYANLVGQTGSRKEGAILVIPFDPDNSYLVQKMEGLKVLSAVGCLMADQLLRKVLESGLPRAR